MTYDVIMIGTGGVGSSAAFHLARRGCRVLGLDRYPGGHDQGSSHGHTRIIRMAYFEHADYVPLLRRAYELWHELEQLVDQQLYCEVGLLQVGPRSGIVVPGVLSSAEKHQLPIEVVESNCAMRSRFAGILYCRTNTSLYSNAEPGSCLSKNVCSRTWPRPLTAVPNCTLVNP